MADNVSSSPPPPPRTFQFIRSSDVPAPHLIWGKDEELVRKAIGEAMNARNVAFLLGAGCSSMWVDGKECGIPTMGPLAKTFCAHPTIKLDENLDQVEPPKWALVADDVEFLGKLGTKLKRTEYKKNLERLMELLHSLHFVFARSDIAEHVARKAKIEGLIAKVQNFLWEHCTDGAFAHGDDSVLALYESFYRKLVMRDRSLPRCLVPGFDGVVFSREWREALWDRDVMGAPRPRTPCEQQYSDRRLRSRR